MKTESNFRKLVRDMRHAQKQYFKYRNKEWLDKAKKLEKQVDEESQDNLKLF